MNQPVRIKKYSGKLEAFDVNKLMSSLRKSGAGEKDVQDVVQKVVGTIYDGITTKQIYQVAFKMLKSRSRVSASKYNLKKALMELGPTGFPFEKLVGKLMEYDGFKTSVGVKIEGHCVAHEVDVVAIKDNIHYIIECKFHSDHGRFCDVKVPLYIQSRFLDVKKQGDSSAGKNITHHGGLFTNTRFTSDALQYGNCVGLLLVSWDYPYQDGLKERIDKAGLHPITALSSLTRAEKTQLLEKGIVLCQDLQQQPLLLEQIRIDKIRQEQVLEDAAALCRTK